MNLEDIRAQLEEDLTWRRDEMRLFRNQLAFMSNSINRRRFRKALIVMLYAHFEGFCKTAFSIYAGAINQERITCGEAAYCIATASFSDVFRALDNPELKSELFRQPLPDDTKLHKFARRVDFITEVDNIWNKTVEIPIDTVVDTESNLKPIVLRKILYQLGFPYDSFEQNEGKIHRLLNYRNLVAHGVQKDGFEEKEYRDLEEMTFDILTEVILLISAALKGSAFKRV